MTPHGRSRGYLKQYHGNNKATFVCAKGHEFKGEVIKRKPKGVGEQGILIMVNWWSKEKGGCSLVCPKCLKGESVIITLGRGPREGG